jgi:hypothetical protein
VLGRIITVNVFVFKSVSTDATSGKLLSCLFIALEHIEQVNPVAIISAFTICALLCVVKNRVINMINIFFIF